MSDLQTKLFEYGIIERSPTEIEAFKTEHRKTYVKEKNAEYAQKQKRKTLLFTLDEFARLEQEAQKHGQKTAPFLKACIFAYLDQHFIFPSDEYIKTLEQAVRNISTKVNESLRYIHLNNEVTLADIQHLKNLLNTLETALSEQLRNPQILHEWLQDQHAKSPNFIPALLQNLSYFFTSQHDC